MTATLWVHFWPPLLGSTFDHHFLGPFLTATFVLISLMMYFPHVSYLVCEPASMTRNNELLVDTLLSFFCLVAGWEEGMGDYNMSPRAPGHFSPNV